MAGLKAEKSRGVSLHRDGLSSTDNHLVNQYLSRFDTDEIDVLRKLFGTLSSKHQPANYIDKVTFLQFFSLPGLWGERLWMLFAHKKTTVQNQPVIDYGEFLVGIAKCCRSTNAERMTIMFGLFDLHGTGLLTREEMVSLLSNVPNVQRYLLQWEDVCIEGTVILDAGHLSTTQEREGGEEGGEVESDSATSHEEGTGSESDSSNDTSSFVSASETESAAAIPSSLVEVKTGVDALMMDSDDDMDFCGYQDDPGVPDGPNILAPLAIPLGHSGAVSAHEDVIPQPATLTSKLTLVATTPVQGGTPQSQGPPPVRDSEILLPKIRERRAGDQTVDELVDEIFMKFGGSTKEGITFVEFKSWMQKAGGFMYLFQKSLHEDFWGLSGTALFGHRNRNENSSDFSYEYPGNQDKGCTGRSCTGRVSRARFNKRQSKVVQPFEGGEAKCNDIQAYTRLLEDFTLKDQADLHYLDFMGDDAIANRLLLACPKCKVQLGSCPRCLQTDTIRFRLLLPDRRAVMSCAKCLQGITACFEKCWNPGCGFEFNNQLKPSTMIRGKGIKTGFMYKLGRTLKRWTKRYYVLMGNMLYYYENENDQKPLGVIFIEGCFVLRLATAASREDDRRRQKELSMKRQSWQAATTTMDDKPQPPAARRGARSSERWGIVIKWKSGHKWNIRELYLDTMALRDEWLESLSFATGQRKVHEVYQFGNKIGQGKFSVVYRAVHRTTGKKVAIKVIKKVETTAMDRELLRTELRVISVLKHPSIIQIHGVYDDQSNVCIVMELVEGGELFDYLATAVNGGGAADSGGIPEVECQKFMKELLDTVSYLATCGIAHRDLKPENILLTLPDASGCCHLKLADFGLSSICGPRGKMTQPCGTLPYVAPEVLGFHADGTKSLPEYGKECDMWACGVIMYLLLRGRLPFNTGRGTIPSVTYKLNLEDFVWRGISNSAKDLITKLCCINTAERLKPDEALNHVWIKNPSAAISAPRASKPPTHLALVPEATYENTQAIDILGRKSFKDVDGSRSYI